jgi:hypothetical protein
VRRRLESEESSYPRSIGMGSVLFFARGTVKHPVTAFIHTLSMEWEGWCNNLDPGQPRKPSLAKAEYGIHIVSERTYKIENTESDERFCNNSAHFIYLPVIQQLHITPKKGRRYSLFEIPNLTNLKLGEVTVEYTPAS